MTNEIGTLTHAMACFTYDAAARKLVTEASTLQANNGGRLFDQIYNDGCDEGFCILSERTGRRARFAVHRTHRDDGDITHWELTPTRQTLRECPETAGLTVVVLND